MELRLDLTDQEAIKAAVSQLNADGYRVVEEQIEGSELILKYERRMLEIR